MREHGALILSDTFPIRLNAFEVLASAGNGESIDTQLIRETAGALDGVSTRFSDTEISTAFAAFADLVRIIALLLDWRDHVLDAGPEADRFKRGALERLSIWQSEYETHPSIDTFGPVVEAINEDLGVAEVSSLCTKLARVPLPVGVYGDRTRRPGIRVPAEAHRGEASDPPPALAVAFLSFTIDRVPVDQVHYLTPYEVHDLEIEVRVSRWPEGMVKLHLSPVSIETAGTYELPYFEFDKPIGDPPFKLRSRGRAAIKIAQSLRAQPFEFRFAAEFLPRHAEQPVSVVGHRTLRIESLDLRRSPLTGNAPMDHRLLRLRDELRCLPATVPRDIEAAMAVAVVLGGLAARAVQDDLFPHPIAEAQLQELIRNELRREPSIGSELEEHPKGSGGEVDLSYRGVRIELKVEPKRQLSVQDCQKFIEQAAAYVSGSDARVGLLCVLDTSGKTTAPFPPEDGIAILRAKSGIPIVTILIQGALVKPSTLSKQKLGGE